MAALCERRDGYLATDITFNANKTSTLAAAPYDAQHRGDPTSRRSGSSTTGNLPARIILGANAVARFGSTTEPARFRSARRPISTQATSIRHQRSLLPEAR